jgi:hypothetical protein
MLVLLKTILVTLFTPYIYIRNSIISHNFGVRWDYLGSSNLIAIGLLSNKYIVFPNTAGNGTKISSFPEKSSRAYTAILYHISY